MGARSDILLSVLEMLESGRSIELVGEVGSGRSYFLDRVRSHFTLLGWRALSFTGLQALKRQPLSVLTMAGFGEGGEGQSGATLRVSRNLGREVAQDNSVIIVDDCDWVDDLSWGVLNSVSLEHNTPILYSRLVHDVHNPLAQPASRANSPSSLQLPSMSYTEIEGTLEQFFGQRLEAPGLSRLYALSDGNIGIAREILDAAMREGRVVPVGDTLRVSGALWTPALRPLAKRVVASLEKPELEALRTLALIGAIDLEHVTRIVPYETIQRLEERAYLGFVTSSSQHLVTVRPPFLEDYFRDAALPGQQAQLLRDVGVTREGYAVETDRSVHGSRDPALIVRLTHEHAKRQIAQTREIWRGSPTLKHATALLRAFSADSPHLDGSIEALIADARDLGGSDVDRVEWEIAHSSYLAYFLGKPEEAIELLTTAAEKYPRHELWIRGHICALEFGVAQLPGEEPFADTPLDGLDVPARTQIVLVRMVWLFVRGRVREAHRLFTAYREVAASDFRVTVASIYIELALGHFQYAAQEANRHLDSAISSSSAAKIRVYAYLSAFVAFLSKRYGEAGKTLALANALGVPVGETPATSRGLSALVTYFSIVVDKDAQAKDLLDRFDELSIIDGILPGQQRALVLCRVALAEGKPEEALRIALKEGDALWQRGAYLAACYMYLEGLQAHPERSAWDRIQPRLKQIDSPAIERWGRYIHSLLSGDIEVLLEIVQAAQKPDSGLSAAGLVEEILNTVPNIKEYPDAFRELDLVAGERTGLRPALPVELSARELEVARLIAAGVPNPRIAEMLYISRRTVESHVLRLNKKTGATKRADLRAYLISTGQWAAALAEEHERPRTRP